ncbi:MAG TPA: GH25 family lysozyme [Anaerolineaceae bacterium]|nr:GH25 family lysozyme [Anaerolineaceae bacterium]HPS33585.1 GH25 family lysozyme [Anaerolineaceae bacterium]
MDDCNVNGQFAFGIDLSVYNSSADGKRRPDFERIAAHQPRVEFAALRTGQSWGYRDPAFAFYVQEARRIGLCVLPYHVVFPAESAARQMDAFLGILEGEDLEHLRLVLDMELEHGQTRRRITDTLNACLEILDEETGRYPIVYSRASWVDQYLEVSDLPELDWWLAQYYARRAYPGFTPEYPCPPRLPKGISSWLIHQTAERAPAIGGSGWYMDYNRWAGKSEDLLRYFGRQIETVPQLCPLDGKPCPRGTAQNQITHKLKRKEDVYGNL